MHICYRYIYDTVIPTEYMCDKYEDSRDKPHPSWYRCVLWMRVVRRIEVVIMVGQMDEIYDDE